MITKSEAEERITFVTRDVCVSLGDKRSVKTVLVIVNMDLYL